MGKAYTARARFDAYGETPDSTYHKLLEAAGFVDAGLSQKEYTPCSYGECVIERNLTEQDGTDYAWKGRLTIHPSMGNEPFVPVTRLREGLTMDHISSQ